MHIENMYREIEALGGATIMDDYDEGCRDTLEAALAVLRKYGFGVDMAPPAVTFINARSKHAHTTPN